MIIINSKHIIFKNVTMSLYIFFKENGIDCILSENINTDPNCDDVYIFVGINKLIKEYPKKYIIYQFEQADSFYYSDSGETEYNYFFNENYLNVLKGAYQVWDYSKSNITWLKNKLGVENIHYVPICFVHNMNKNIKAEKDIDILFYGSLNKKRKTILNRLEEVAKSNGLNLVIQNNDCWDEDLDKLIARAKIVLNIHFYENATLELHRLSQLLSNKCFVMCEASKDKELIHKYKGGMEFAQHSDVASRCLYWLGQSTEERTNIANKGHGIFKTEKYENYIPNEILSIKSTKEKIEIKQAEDTEQNNDELDVVSNKKTQHNEQKKKNRRKKKNTNEGINWYIPCDLDEAQTQVDNINNNFILKLPQIEDEDLPYVSIITPTRNRRKMFNIAIKNYSEFIYPREKLEWIIVDDGHEDISDLLIPYRKENVKYIKIDGYKEEAMAIGKKRNTCVENCTHNHIISMDDDDYYPPESILSRVKIFAKYPNKKCVGCNEIGCYDLFGEKSYLASDGYKYFSEASLSFKKEFWEERPFFDNDRKAEGKYFLQYREQDMVNAPFQFVIIALNHKTNTSAQFRNRDMNVENDQLQSNSNDLYQLFTFETKVFLDDLKRIL
jgi:hypothetical protein